MNPAFVRYIQFNQSASQNLHLEVAVIAFSDAHDSTTLRVEDNGLICGYIVKSQQLQNVVAMFLEVEVIRMVDMNWIGGVPKSSV